MSLLLEARSLTKEYKRGDRPFLAVDDVSLQVETGEFACIVGHSGSGKSTLLNMLAGMASPTSGAVVFMGRDYSAMTDGELSRQRGSKIGYIMQGHCVLPNFTVSQNVMIPNYFHNSSLHPEGRASLLLEKTGIGHLASQYPSNLSGGELRRVSIARSLFSAPDLLIADEPTGDLDAETTAEIMALFSSIREEGTSILMVTHELDLLQGVDRRYVMESGRLMEMKVSGA
ncbi:MAG: ABC transporter ATP-binding protein [Synergistaceae bacterium]|jgi:putative ABC transport system ATP-binding protein|nr:ABC transporter ATP-binding protein [Synergistaceae bacterium]